MGAKLYRKKGEKKHHRRRLRNLRNWDNDTLLGLRKILSGCWNILQKSRGGQENEKSQGSKGEKKIKHNFNILQNKKRWKEIAVFISPEWLLRGVSLFLAVILWSFVGGESRIDKDIMVPVEIINLPQDLVISNQYKKELRVSVNGSRSNVRELENMENLIRLIDLASAKEGSKVVHNTAADIPVGRGVTVQRIQPESIILSLDSLISKELPIQVRTVGKPINGYYLQAKTAAPASISITGSQTKLLGIDVLMTRPVNLSEMEGAVQMQVPLELSDELTNMIGETSVTVSLDIRPIAESITIEGLPVQAVVDGERAVVEPKEVTVVAAIPAGYLAARTAPASLVTVRAEGEKGAEELAVQAAGREGLPLPVYIESVIPETVRVVGGARGGTAGDDREDFAGEEALPLEGVRNGSGSVERVPTLRSVKKKRVFIREQR